MDATDLTALTAAEIVARVHDGRVSAVDVARAYLARIAHRDPHLGAFQEHRPERVLAEAEGVDRRADRFALPLAGVPVAVTDCIDVAGYPTRRGSIATCADPVKRDDELVKRVRQAGAIVIGKTRMPELAVWSFTASAWGITHHPHEPALDPGGSGGAGAVAVAAGMATLALAVDGGGAIRVPAAHCGLVGLKPGHGVVPLPGRADEHWCGLSATGPIARTAQDAALLLGVLRGAPVDIRAESGPLRVALSVRAPTPLHRLRGDHRAAAVGAAARLRAAPGGATVVLADPPYPRGLTTRWIRRWQAGVAHEAAALGLDLSAVEPRTAAVVRRGRRSRPGPPTMPAWREGALEWFADGGFDLLVTPATACPPLPVGGLPGRGYLATLRACAAHTLYTRAWNLAGLPAVVAPMLIEGRPVGVQLVGRPGSEAALLAAAARLEQQVVPRAEAAPRRVYA